MLNQCPNGRPQCRKAPAGCAPGALLWGQEERVSALLCHGFAQAYRGGGFPVGVELQRALGHEQHDGGAEQEASHFFAALQADVLVGIAPFAQLAGAWRVDHAVPDGGHAAHHGGADQYQHEGAEFALKHADHALVARKQAGHATGGGGVDREQLAGDVDHAQQAPGAGHVDAVVVAWAQIDGGKVPVGKLRGQLCIAADQRLGAVVMAFGLKDLVACIAGDGAQLADGAIDGADPVGIGQGAHARAQGAGEELVEGGVGGGVTVQGLAHVDLVALDEPANDRGGEAAAFQTGQRAHETGQCLFWEQILGQDGKAVGHGSEDIKKAPAKLGLAGADSYQKLR